MTPEAKSWSYFIGARLMPAILHSSVQRWRGILTCAILMGATVDVDRVINIEMKVAFDARSNRALGFPVLITQLCHLAGVDVTSSDPTDSI